MCSSTDLPSTSDGVCSGTIEQMGSDKVVSEIVINTAAGPVTSIITTGSVKRMNLKKGNAVSP